jgi:hypothetical protein
MILQKIKLKRKFPSPRMSLAQNLQTPQVVKSYSGLSRTRKKRKTILQIQQNVFQLLQKEVFGVKYIPFVHICCVSHLKPSQ